QGGKLALLARRDSDGTWVVSAAADSDWQVGSTTLAGGRLRVELRLGSGLNLRRVRFEADFDPEAAELRGNLIDGAATRALALPRAVEAPPDAGG
ncbi:MAG TPA: hypothetical protein VGC54_04780, partial [Planctomycetota bacterium]